MSQDVKNVRLNHAKDVKRMLSKQINKVRKANLDIETESRLIAQLSNRLIDSIKLDELILLEKEANESGNSMMKDFTGAINAGRELYKAQLKAMETKEKRSNKGE